MLYMTKTLRKVVKNKFYKSKSLEDENAFKKKETL